MTLSTMCGRSSSVMFSTLSWTSLDLLTLRTGTFSALFRALHVCLILSHTLGFNWLHLAWLRCAWLGSLILSFPSFHPSWLPSTFFPSAWLWLGSASLSSAWLHSAKLGSASLGFIRLGFTLLSLARLGMASSFWKAFFAPSTVAGSCIFGMFF